MDDDKSNEEQYSSNANQMAFNAIETVAPVLDTEFCRWALSILVTFTKSILFNGNQQRFFLVRNYHASIEPFLETMPSVLETRNSTLPLENDDNLKTSNYEMLKNDVIALLRRGTLIQLCQNSKKKFKSRLQLSSNFSEENKYLQSSEKSPRTQLEVLESVKNIVKNEQSIPPPSILLSSMKIACEAFSDMKFVDTLIELMESGETNAFVSRKLNDSNDERKLLQKNTDNINEAVEKRRFRRQVPDSLSLRSIIVNYLIVMIIFLAVALLSTFDMIDIRRPEYFVGSYSLTIIILALWVSRTQDLSFDVSNSSNFVFSKFYCAYFLQI